MAAIPTFFARRWRSLGHATLGLVRLVRGEVHARVYLAATLLVGVAGWQAQFTAEAWRWLILACALVWSAEAINTAIERLGDRVCASHDPAIGAAKDLAAGALLVAALAASAIGASLFLPLLVGGQS